MQRAISGLWVAWNPLIAPQAMVMKRQGNTVWSPTRVFIPPCPSETCGIPSPFHISGIDGQWTKSPTIRAIAMNMSENAKIG